MFILFSETPLVTFLIMGFLMDPFGFGSTTLLTGVSVGCILKFDCDPFVLLLL